MTDCPLCHLSEDENTVLALMRYFEKSTRAHGGQVQATFNPRTRKWVINKTEEMVVSFNVLMRSRICACIVTSRFEVGSSAIRSFG